MGKKEHKVYLFQVICWGACSAIWLMLATTRYLSHESWTMIVSNAALGVSFLCIAIGNGSLYLKQKREAENK